MAQAKKRPKSRPVQAPKRSGGLRSNASWLVPAAIALVALGAIGIVALVRDGGESKQGVAAGLPRTSDYHSLLVSPTQPQVLLLGTHQGIFRSADGGRTWAFAQLNGQDAMNLAPAAAQTIWTAGHNVLAKSTDGGASWVDVRPDGLPSLDVHGFTVDPRDANTLYAAIAGEGLYRSADGGVSFEVASNDVGGAVMALAVTPDGRILAGDMRNGLLVSSDAGQTWRQQLRVQLLGLAVNPRDPKRIVAAGAGGVNLSTDGGRTWRQVLAVPDGAGPVAWSPAAPARAYVVGFDGVLYTTSDGGESWRPVGEGMQ
jgi:photosystem II stability/assembly factor-like uncharacterized protein